MHPRVTVLMPTYNAAKYLRDSIDSVRGQDFHNWEILVINELGSNDGSAAIVQEYAKCDSRIRLVQNQEKLGLARSLNLGMCMAKGAYIARLDADDLALPTRLSKQVAFLDSHPHIAVCGSWQRHFGTENWIHKPPAEPELCRAFLLFFCHLCHSTLMFRKQAFIENELFFSADFLAEDFELWSRAVGVVDFANLPEVLGEYRHSSQNITEFKRRDLAEESGRIVVSSVKRYLKLDIPVHCVLLLNTWNNIYTSAQISGNRKKLLSKLEFVLRQIWQANQREQFYDDSALLSAIQSKWRWAKYGLDWKQMDQAAGLEEIFSERYHGAFLENWKRFQANNPTFYGKCKKIMRKVFPFK